MEKKSAPKAKAPAKKEKKAPAKAKVRVSCAASIFCLSWCFGCEAPCRLFGAHFADGVGPT
jgi:hypothetical protein